MDFLWTGRIPLGMVTVVVGPGGAHPVLEGLIGRLDTLMGRGLSRGMGTRMGLGMGIRMEIGMD